MYFAVSTAKLVVMDVATLGLYSLYWFYANWRLVRARENTNIMPPLRALFAYLFCYTLFSRIKRSADEVEANYVLNPMGAALAWISVRLTSLLPDPFWLFSLASVLLLAYVQNVVNEINTKTVPSHDPNTTFSKLNLLAIVIGGSITALVVWEVLSPTPA